jgi:hypothetical protein
MVNDFSTFTIHLSLKHDHSAFLLPTMLITTTPWYQTLPSFVYAAIAWSFVIAIALNILSLLKQASDRTQKMHQIPCANCQFFTDNYALKCTIHPENALTEAAIDCSDFRLQREGDFPRQLVLTSKE